MSCKNCDDRNEGQEGIAYYRWKNANIGVMGCDKHLKEVFNALNMAQNPDLILVLGKKDQEDFANYIVEKSKSLDPDIFKNGFTDSIEE